MSRRSDMPQTHLYTSHHADKGTTRLLLRSGWDIHVIDEDVDEETARQTAAAYGLELEITFGSFRRLHVVPQP